MKQPTAEDVMASLEVVKLYRRIAEEHYGDEATAPIVKELNRASRVIHTWFDQFDEQEGG